jgi:hypothetical protein
MAIYSTFTIGQDTVRVTDDEKGPAQTPVITVTVTVDDDDEEVTVSIDHEFAARVVITENGYDR